jgi:hypothetical protein
MDSGRVRRSLWWSRFRLRWRRKAKRLEPSHALDAVVTSGLVIAGILTATSHVEESAKISIVLLLAVVEIVFVFSRLILRQLHKMSARTLGVLPNDLPTTLFDHLNGERVGFLNRARELSDNKVCDLEKHEMYASLIHLTDTVTTHKAGTIGGAIYAVSGTDIEDFMREELAQAYLTANKRAVANQVIVRRVFLLDGSQCHSPKVKEIMRLHEDALRDQQDGESGIRWIRKADAGDDKSLDFALFAREVLVRQVHRPGGVKGVKAEMTFNEVHVDDTLEAFDRLWGHPKAKTLAEFEVHR